MESPLPNAVVRSALSSAATGESNPDMFSVIDTWMQDPSLLAMTAMTKWDLSEKLLGEGANYEVRERTMEISGVPTAVAVKRLRYSMPKPGTMFESPSEFQNIRPLVRDLRVMQCMKLCPVIIDLISTELDVDANGDDFRPILAVELATHGTLAAFLAIKNLLPGTTVEMAVSTAFASQAYATRKGFIADVATGLFSLHAAHIFHTDVKPDNVLVCAAPDSASGFRAKLSDFGSALIHDPKRPSPRFPLGRNGGGTPRYIAPELEGLKANEIMELSDVELQKVDVYSFGVLMAESLTSCVVRDGSFIGELCTWLSSETQDCVPAEDVPRIKKLLDQCLLDVASRIDGFHQILIGLQVPFPATAAAPTPSDMFDPSMFDWTDLSKIVMEVMLEYRFAVEDEVVLQMLNIPRLQFYGILQYALGLTKFFMPFIPVMALWGEFLARLDAGSPSQLMLTALSYSSDPNWNLLDCCQKLLEAAQKDCLPARIIYRRIHEALFSIPSNHDSGLSPESCPPATAIQAVDSDVFSALELIDEQQPDNFLAGVCAFYLRTLWTQEVRDRLGEMMSLVTKEPPRDIGLSSPETIYILQDFVRKELEAMVAANRSPEDVMAAGGSTLLAGAIVFDDENSTLLNFACDTWLKLGIPLAIHLQALRCKKMSLLTLACVLGNASSVRVLCKHDPDSSLNQMASLDGDIPLHYLFVFREDEMEEMFTLLSAGVDLNSPLCADGGGPEGDICFLHGSPLDFACQVGSEKAMLVLWPSLKRTSLVFPEDTLKLFKVLYGLDVLVIDAIKCFASCSPSIWENFVSDLSPEEIGKLKRYATNLLIDTEGSTLFLYAFTAALCINKLNNMVLYGSRYFERLVLQLSSGISFLVDVCGAKLEENIALTLLQVIPDADIFFAVSLSLSTTSDALQQFNGSDIHGVFSMLTLMTPQYTWLSRNIGLILPKEYNFTSAFIDIHAATKANNMVAVRRVLERTKADGMCLRDQCVIEYLTRQFSKEWTPAVRDCLAIISQLDCPPTRSWSSRLLSSSPFGDEESMTNAINHHNADMLLLLLDGQRLFQGLPLPSSYLLYLLCTNDRHAMILQSVLDKLDPQEAVRMITERTKYTRLTALDIALLSGSTTCLRELGEFLNTKGQNYITDKEKLYLIVDMLQAAADVAIGFNTDQSLVKVIHSITSPLSLPRAVIQATQEVAAASDTQPPPSCLFLIIKFAYMLKCHEIPGFENLKNLEERVLPHLPSDMPPFEKRTNTSFQNSFVDEARIIGIYCMLGKMRRHWRLSLVGIGMIGIISTATSVIMTRGLLRGIRRGVILLQGLLKGH